MTLSDMFSLEDRIVIITGGLGQLGRQYIQAIHAVGGRVAVFDILEEENAREQLNALNPDALYCQVDITSRKSICNGLSIVQKKLGTPYGLVNNAALDSPPGSPEEENGPFETYPEESWDKIMEVNAKGVFLTCQIVGGGMANAGGGSIVNICSTYGIVSPNQSLYEYRRKRGEVFFKPVAYSASKSALLNFTRYIATYFAPRGVRANLLTPGGIFNNQDEEFLSGYCDKVPLGRMADEAEYNGAIVFMLSDASSYMTGSNLVIDGGWTAW